MGEKKNLHDSFGISYSILLFFINISANLVHRFFYLALELLPNELQPLLVTNRDTVSHFPFRIACGRCVDNREIRQPLLLTTNKTGPQISLTDVTFQSVFVVVQTI